MALNIDLDDILPTAVCPECEEDIELCGECGDIIHDYQTKAYGYDGADVLCETCYRKRRGQCRRRKL